MSGRTDETVTLGGIERAGPTSIVALLSSEKRGPMTAPRFLTLSDVAEILNISASQTYALVRSGDLTAIKIGGRGQWRVEREQLEAYISRMYDQTKQFVAEHPFIDSTSEQLSPSE